MELSRLIPGIKRLPSSPQLLPRLMQVLKDPHASSQEIVNTVKLDMSVAVQVQRLSNSTYYGFAEPSRDLEQAIARIGMQETYKLVAAVLSQELSNRSRNKTQSRHEEILNRIWENSVVSAISMELLAERLSFDTMDAYAIGLMHNIGLVLIYHADSKLFEQIMGLIDKGEHSLLEAEQKVLGFNHSDAARLLLEFWKFSESMIEPISFQFQPDKAPNFKTPAYMLYATLLISSELELSLPGLQDQLTYQEEFMQPIGLDKETLSEFSGAVLNRFTQVKEIFNPK